MKCHSKLCESLARVRVYWPGMNPAPCFCMPCAERAVLTLKVIGVRAPIEMIEVSLEDLANEHPQ